MVTVRPFTCFDLLKYGNINLNPYTETYTTRFYLHYLSKWPELIRIHESPTPVCLQGQNTPKSVAEAKPTTETTRCANIFAKEKIQNRELTSQNCGRLMGYMIAKAEGHGSDWHGHVTALSVAPEYRRLRLATKLMLELEETSDRKRCHYVDLFVRESNKLGLEIYTKLGYIVYRRVLNYYWSSQEDEDALDMRKALSADVDKKSVIPLTQPVLPESLEFL